jgi:hypothetical protein
MGTTPFPHKGDTAQMDCLAVGVSSSTAQAQLSPLISSPLRLHLILPSTPPLFALNHALTYVRIAGVSPPCLLALRAFLIYKLQDIPTDTKMREICEHPRTHRTALPLHTYSNLQPHQLA